MNFKSGGLHHNPQEYLECACVGNSIHTIDHKRLINIGR